MWENIYRLYFIKCFNQNNSYNVKDIASGIYYYDSIRHFLKVIKKDFQPNNFKKLTLSYSLSEKAAFVIYILGIINLTGYKYGDRGYRFMQLEAGHLA